MIINEATETAVLSGELEAGVGATLNVEVASQFVYINNRVIAPPEALSAVDSVHQKQNCPRGIADDFGKCSHIAGIA